MRLIHFFYNRNVGHLWCVCNIWKSLWSKCIIDAIQFYEMICQNYADCVMTGNGIFYASNPPLLLRYILVIYLIIVCLPFQECITFSNVQVAFSFIAFIFHNIFGNFYSFEWVSINSSVKWQLRSNIDLDWNSEWVLYNFCILSGWRTEFKKNLH